MKLHHDFGRHASPDALRRHRTKAILKQVAAEREVQEETWGQQDHPNGTDTALWGELADNAKAVNDTRSLVGKITWASILQEEVYEALAEEDPLPLRAELLQVAAVCVNWIEAIDRRPRLVP
jgi:hypothetical protein